MQSTKRIEERIDEDVLRWFSHVERMENDRFAKRVYVGVCAGTHSVGRLRRIWTDTMKECLRKRFVCQRSKENSTGQV